MGCTGGASSLSKRLLRRLEHNRDAERRALLELKERLVSHEERLLQLLEQNQRQTLIETEAASSAFKPLSQAVELMANLLERNAASELMSQLTKTKHPVLPIPLSKIIPGPSRLPSELDFRVRYLDKHFHLMRRSSNSAVTCRSLDASISIS